MVFKGQSWYFRLYKWNICFTICYKTDENLKFTILKLRNEFKVVLIHFIRKTETIFLNFQTKNMGIWKPLYRKSLTPPKGLTFRSDGFRKGILVSFSDATFWNTYTNIIIIEWYVVEKLALGSIKWFIQIKSSPHQWYLLKSRKYKKGCCR